VTTIVSTKQIKEKVTSRKQYSSLAMASGQQQIIYGPEVLFKTCVAMKFVDDDDDDDDDMVISTSSVMRLRTLSGRQ